jgi:hypothetical protein
LRKRYINKSNFLATAWAKYGFHSTSADTERDTKENIRSAEYRVAIARILSERRTHKASRAKVNSVMLRSEYPQ